jgi:aspartokinase
VEKVLINGIIQRANLNAFMVSSTGDSTDMVQIFKRLARDNINIEFINLVPHNKDSEGIVICVARKDMYSVLALMKEIKAVEICSLGQAGILSVFPHRENPAILSTIIQTMCAAKIPLFAIGSSMSSISCVINEENVPDALRLLSREFGLS